MLNNPLFPPPFGQSSSTSSPKLRNKRGKETSSFTSGVHVGAGTATSGASGATRDQDQFDNRSLWRDNVSSSSSNVQDRGGTYNLSLFTTKMV